MPEGAHPLPPAKGWGGLPFVPLDGKNWPLDFAAKILNVPLDILRQRVKEENLQPSGVIRMQGFRRQGRAPRAYPADDLIRIAEKFSDSPDSV